MFTKIPKSWLEDFDNKTITLEYLNDLMLDLHIPTIIYIVILMVVGVFGNILVVYIYSTKYHSSTYRCFILWLGWIDLIACAVGMPLLIVSMLYPYMFPSVQACKIFRFLHVFFVVSSAFIVIAIAFERHRRVCYDFSLEMSIKKITCMCLLATACGFLVALPAFWIFGDAVIQTGVGDINGTECFIDPQFDGSKLPELYFLFQLLLSLLSMLILGIFYFRIGRRIWSHHRFLRDNTYNPENKDKKRAKLGSITVGTTDFNNPVCNTAMEKSSYYPESPLPLDNDVTRNVFHKGAENNHSDKNTPNIVKKERSNSLSSNTSQQSTPKTDRRSYTDKNRTPHPGASKTRQGPSVRTRQVTTMLFIITLVFVLSFIPHLVLMIMNSKTPEFLDDMTPAGIAVYNIFLRTFVINNMANPIIYGFLDKKFRIECTALVTNTFRCCRK